jgi:hypothetical protein
MGYTFEESAQRTMTSDTPSSTASRGVRDTANEWSPPSTTWSVTGPGMAAMLLRLAGRVQRVAERNRSGQLRPLPATRDEARGGQVRGHAAAHRFAADEEAMAGELVPRRGRVHHPGEARLEQGRAIGHLAALVHVVEVEGDDVDAAGREARGDSRHEWVVLPGAGAVGQHQQAASGRRRAIDGRFH